MKRLILTLLGAMPKAEHHAKIQNMADLIRSQEEEIKELRRQLEAPPETHVKPGRNTAKKPTAIQAGPVFNRVVDLIFNRNTSIKIDGEDGWINTESGEVIGQIRDEQTVYITNKFVLDVLNMQKQTNRKKLPVGFLEKAHRNKIITSSGYAEKPHVHSLFMPDGTSCRAVLISPEFIESRKQVSDKLANHMVRERSHA